MPGPTKGPLLLFGKRRPPCLRWWLGLPHSPIAKRLLPPARPALPARRRRLRLRRSFFQAVPGAPQLPHLYVGGSPAGGASWPAKFSPLLPTLGKGHTTGAPSGAACSVGRL